jgi:uncharacterized LabA/DUF88 family protein
VSTTTIIKKPEFSERFEAETPTLRLAVLIDADNAQPSIIGNLFLEIASFGEATVKRIYGDFTQPTSNQWKQALQSHSIKPIQQFRYTTGKNSTDSALIIDAMDLLYTGTFDGFCLVSSDSDFTGLAVRIREHGLKVFGFGEKKTPEQFIKACHKFTFTEKLRPINQKTDKITSAIDTVALISTMNKPITTLNINQVILSALKLSIGDDDGWVRLSALGYHIHKNIKDFDLRKYGFKKLSDLIKGTKKFIIEERNVKGSNTKEFFIRLNK